MNFAKEIIAIRAMSGGLVMVRQKLHGAPWLHGELLILTPNRKSAAVRLSGTARLNLGDGVVWGNVLALEWCEERGYVELFSDCPVEIKKLAVGNG